MRKRILEIRSNGSECVVDVALKKSEAETAEILDKAWRLWKCTDSETVASRKFGKGATHEVALCRPTLERILKEWGVAQSCIQEYFDDVLVKE